MRAALLLSLSLLSLVACEPMEEPGGLFEAVSVSEPASTSAVEPAAEPTVDDAIEDDLAFPDFEPVVIHSSELGQDAPELPAVVEAQPPELAAEPVPPEPTAAAVAPVEPEPALTTATVNTHWPLRVVATVPSAQPPRAILGLPNGKELVVSPGSMIPDAGVVVMAVGTRTVELAEVRPAGDHAVIQDRTLHALNSQTVEIEASP